MKPAFLIIALTCLLLQSEARVFRGNFLKGQDPDDIADLPENSPHTHEGDAPHQRAVSESTASTAGVLQSEIASGLREDFQFIKDSLTQFADEDGFVREGIVFCGAAGLPTPATGDYHSDTGRLVLNDGYGNDVSVVNDEAVCGSSNCEEGSFVALLSNRIRALGYHVTHSDLCMARSTNTENNVDVARTCKLQRNTLERKTRDNLAGDKQCYQYSTDTLCCGTGNDGARTPGTCDASSSGPQCTWDAVEEVCYAATGNDESTNHPKIDGDTAITKNAVRRVFTFGQGDVNVGATDKVYVTGAVSPGSGASGCKSLRQYVAALNGMAQINAFRDTGIEETEDNWARVITDARTGLEEYADILSDFYDNSVKLFPLIEYEEPEACPMGEVELQDGDAGDVTAPECDRNDYHTLAALSGTTFELQEILREKCFCRNNAVFGDLAYLKTTVGGCTALVGSADTFCDKPILEAHLWNQVLGNLQPLDKDVYVPPGSSTTKSSITANIAKTLPTVALQAANCGRLVNSDNDNSDTTKSSSKFSNKGGNCVPFGKFQILLRRLERESTGYSNGNAEGFAGLYFAGTEFPHEFYGDDVSSNLPDNEIEEAIFTTEVAQLAKRKTAGDNANLWAALEEELTSTDTGRINQEIAHEAAEHFMRVVTTDHDDDAVHNKVNLGLGEYTFADSTFGTLSSFVAAIRATADATCDDVTTPCNLLIERNFYMAIDGTRVYNKTTDELLTAAATATWAYNNHGFANGTESGYATDLLTELNGDNGESQTDVTQYRHPYTDGSSRYMLTMKADEWELKFEDDNQDWLTTLSGTRDGNTLTASTSTDRGMIVFVEGEDDGWPVVTLGGNPLISFSL